MKINGQKTNATHFAYDGCHKIYLIEDEMDLNEANIMGYDILPISRLEKTFNESCVLQFISNWKLDKSYAEQFEADVCFDNA